MHILGYLGIVMHSAVVRTLVTAPISAELGTSLLAEAKNVLLLVAELLMGSWSLSFPRLSARS